MSLAIVKEKCLFQQIQIESYPRARDANGSVGTVHQNIETIVVVVFLGADLSHPSRTWRREKAIPLDIACSAASSWVGTKQECAALRPVLDAGLEDCMDTPIPSHSEPKNVDLG